MILLRVWLISGRLNLTRRRLAREIKTGSGPEGAIDPRSVRGRLGRPPSHRAPLSHRTHLVLFYTTDLQRVT